MAEKQRNLLTGTRGNLEGQSAKTFISLRLAPRRITTTMLAERAGMTRTTLRSIERGGSGVTLGAYASVLFCLGLEQDLLLVGKDDPLGRKLQDAGLTQTRRRVSRKEEE